ncbi:MAG: undecaprenyl/decaprenyl-phosphate alpha-N-acetylglucosaminyl 1-phosphate transferase, partial [Thermoflexales bacterium]|nr:undecaprenyl/decaprenyl-phosphate alpha-N-acetylglucosaminyl 1-phosphate transferase [Thermoflexales bacterium]
MPHLIVLATGFGLSVCLTAVAIRLGLRFGLADAPGGRRKHARLTSRFGALPLFGAFTLSALVGRALGVPSLDPNEPTRFAAFLLGGVVLFVLAVLDDARGLSPAPQLGLQVLGASVAISGQVFIERFTNPFTRAEVVLPDLLGSVLGTIAVVGISLFWFLGMINTVNLLDGVDGLAASVGVIACAVTAVHMLREGQDSVALLP